MPTFFGRRYTRRLEDVSTTEKAVGIAILILLVGIVVTFAIHVTSSAVNPAPSAQVAVAVRPFPDPGVADWSPPSDVHRFTPDDLYVKIDGRADIYLQYHVKSLTFGAYRYADDEYRTIDVYWYEMGAPVDAYGIFQAEAAPGADPVAIGREGYQTGGAVFFCKGASYVQVLPTSVDPADGEVALRIARLIGERIEGADEPIWAERVLPAAGRLPDSFIYIAQDAFSLGFLSDVFAAHYDIDGERMTLFVHRAPENAAAENLLDQYIAFFKKYGEVTWRDSDAERHIVAGEVYRQTDVVFARGRYFAGVTGAKDLDKARTAASAFYDSLE